MRLVEVAVFIVFLPFFAHILFSGKCALEREYQNYIRKSRDLYALEQTVNSFKYTCVEGKILEEGEIEIKEVGFKDGKTLLKMNYRNAEFYGVKEK